MQPWNLSPMVDPQEPMSLTSETSLVVHGFFANHMVVHARAEAVLTHRML